MKLTEFYKCNECGSVWSHTWDDDKNNDYTQCPKGCDEFDFDEIDNAEYLRLTNLQQG